MVKVIIKANGEYIGMTYMDKYEIRKAEYAGFTISYANQKGELV